MFGLEPKNIKEKKIKKMIFFSGIRRFTEHFASMASHDQKIIHGKSSYIDFFFLIFSWDYWFFSLLFLDAYHFFCLLKTQWNTCMLTSFLYKP